MKIYANFNKHEYVYNSFYKDDLHHLLHNEQEQDFNVTALGNGRYSLVKNGRSYLIHLNRSEGIWHVNINGAYFPIQVEDERMRKVKELVKKVQSGPQELVIKAPIPGVVIKVNVEEGKSISKGEPLLILEAMKMENVIKANCDCQVEKILIKEKEAVQQNQELIRLVTD